MKIDTALHGVCYLEGFGGASSEEFGVDVYLMDEGNKFVGYITISHDMDESEIESKIDALMEQQS